MLRIADSVIVLTSGVVVMGESAYIPAWSSEGLKK